jgi:myo-inositol-1(or 4)-monophosphatase
MNIQWETETALAMRAAVEGGRIALEHPARTVARRKESARDVVTSADLAVERHIREFLSQSGYPVIGEEAADEHCYPLLNEGPVWIVDPIDGTANYVNGLDYYAVSVGLCRAGDFLVGAVCMPHATELFCTLGAGRSLLNGRTLVYEHCPLDASLVAASFAGAADGAELRQRQYRVFGEINDATRGCLRLGSAASNICFVAAGRLQAAYGLRARLWDVAAGLAVAIGAGCRVLVAASSGGAYVDYIVGSKESVSPIHELCVRNHLMDEECRIW